MVAEANNRFSRTLAGGAEEAERGGRGFRCWVSATALDAAGWLATASLRWIHDQALADTPTCEDVRPAQWWPWALPRPVSVSTVGGAEEEDLMRRQPWGLYAIALPIIAGGLVVLGVPVLALLFAAFVLACPFIMVFVMSVMRVGNGIHDG